MRSSNKSRSRNKNQNNRRPTGNVINRVFDSSGPEGKVRGTPQQIIEKYQMLARDAQLAGDRVAAENFQQHSEHYTRLLSEAMREQNERREQHEAQQQNTQNNQNNQGQPQNQGGQGQQARHYSRDRDDQPDVQDYGNDDQPDIPMVPVAEMQRGGDSGLVETPESAAQAAPVKKRTRRPSKPKTDAPATEPNPAE